MTIKYIISADSSFESDTSLVTNLYEAATQLGLNTINIDLLEEFSADELIQIITQAETEQLYFFLVISAGNPTPKYSIDTLNRIWIALKEKNQDSKFIVLANALNPVQADTLVDVFTSVYAILMLAEHFWFTHEHDYYSFIAESSQHASKNLELAKRVNLAKYLDMNYGLEQIFKAETTVVDTNFWYSELEIVAAVRALLPKHQLKMPLTEGSALILNDDPSNSIYSSRGRTITICPTLILGQAAVTNQADLNYFKLAIESLFKLERSVTKHSITFAVNWIERRHFCLGVITFDINHSNGAPLIDSSKVLISVMDTKFRDSCVSMVQGLLTPLIQELSSQQPPLNIVANPLYSCPQPDDNSCGVLVAELMLDFILENKLKYSVVPVSLAQIKEMRIKHHNALNSEQFSTLQHNKDALKHVKPRKAADEPPVVLPELLAQFTKYLADIGATQAQDVVDLKQWALVFIICDLNMQIDGADETIKSRIATKLYAAQQLIDIKNEEFAFAAKDLSYDSAEQQARLYSGQLKAWFSVTQHEDALRSESYGGFLNFIFKPRVDTAEDLEWQTALEGKNNLIHIIEMLFNLHLTKKSKKAIKQQEQDNNEPIDYMYGAVSLINVASDGYSYAGSVNADSQAHGAGAEKITAMEYSYTGQYYNNCKVGDGVERHTIQGTNITLEFCGSRDMRGKYYAGAIVCILGPTIGTGELMIFNGRLEQGKAHGSAVISVYYPDDKKLKLPVCVEIDDGEIIALLKNPNRSIKEEWEYNILHYASEHIGNMSIDPDPDFDQSLNIMRALLTAKSPDQPAKGFYPSHPLPTRSQRNLTIEIEQTQEPDSPHSGGSASSGASGRVTPRF